MKYSRHDFSRHDLIIHLYKKLKYLNPDTPKKAIKDFIIDEVTFHKYMTKKQAKKICSEINTSPLEVQN